MKSVIFSLLSIIIFSTLSCDKQPSNTDKNDIQISIIKIFSSKENLTPIEIIINYNKNEILICNNNLDIAEFVTIPPKSPEHSTSVEHNILKKDISINTELVKLTIKETQSIKKIIESFISDDFKSRYKDLKDGRAVTLMFIYENDYKDIKLINDFSERHISLIKEVLNILSLRSINSEYLIKHYNKY